MLPPVMRLSGCCSGLLRMRSDLLPHMRACGGTERFVTAAGEHPVTLVPQHAPAGAVLWVNSIFVERWWNFSVWLEVDTFPTPFPGWVHAITAPSMCVVAEQQGWAMRPPHLLHWNALSNHSC